MYNNDIEGCDLNDNGFTYKTETEYDAKGGSTTLYFYDYKLTKEGYSRILKVFEGATLCIPT